MGQDGQTRASRAEANAAVKLLRCLFLILGLKQRLREALSGTGAGRGRMTPVGESLLALRDTCRPTGSIGGKHMALAERGVLWLMPPAGGSSAGPCRALGCDTDSDAGFGRSTAPEQSKSAGSPWVPSFDAGVVRGEALPAAGEPLVWKREHGRTSKRPVRRV